MCHGMKSLHHLSKGSNFHYYDMKYLISMKILQNKSMNLYWFVKKHAFIQSVNFSQYENKYNFIAPNKMILFNIGNESN